MAQTYLFSKQKQESFARWLGRELNSDELAELTKMAQEHLGEYMSEALITNAGIAEKIRLWKKAESVLGRQLTNLERDYIESYMEEHGYVFGLNEDELMEKVKSWM